MNQRGFLSLSLIGFFLVLALALGGYYWFNHQKPPTVNQPIEVAVTPLPTPLIQGQIGLVEGSNLYLYDLATNQKQKLEIPDLIYPANFVFSHDGNKVFVESSRGVKVFDLVTKTSSDIIVDGPNPRVTSLSSIAPNDQLLVATESCCPGDAGQTIVTSEGKILKQLLGSDIAWSPDSTKLALGKGEITLHLGLGPEPANSSIYLEQINGQNVNEKLLMKGTSQVSFLPVKWQDNKTLLVKKTFYSQPFPDHVDSHDYWINIFENSTLSYFNLDVDTLKTQDIAYQEPTLDNASYSSDHQWKVYVDSKTSIVGPVYVSKIDGSDKHLISQDGFAIWRP